MDGHGSRLVDVLAERRLRRRIVALAGELRMRGLVTSTVGNISVRHGERILITPTRHDPDDLRPRDLVTIAPDGTVVGSPRLQPSTEWRLHAAVYAARPDVGAVVHTHSPYATARSFDPDPLVVCTEERTYLGLHEIHVAEQEPAGSAALGHSAVRALGSRDAVLLARHGVIGVGPTPRAALELAGCVEQQAIIELATRGLIRASV
ncbi:MAG: class aldolase/adducin family protein [Solirubrobacterales bacterium]|nr:class aldolase/adducin family protein [Solirubrobacterales bacterium]